MFLHSHPVLAPFRLFCLSSILSLAAPAPGAVTENSGQKRIIDDFEDVSTWRQREGRGQDPATWFSAGSSFGGSTRERCHGSYVGELFFSIEKGAPSPYRFSFERVRISQLPVARPDGIEFMANSQGLPVRFSFVLLDAGRRQFSTRPVPVSGDTWRLYRLELNGQTVSGWDRIQLPLVMQRFVMETETAVQNARVFVDDLAFTGAFDEDRQLDIRPVYEKINYAPGNDVVLRYRILNALPVPCRIHVTARIMTAKGTPVRTAGFARRDNGSFVTDLELPAHGEAVASFNLGPLPVGAYSAEVIADRVRSGSASGPARAGYDDTFGVFVPNGGRFNKHPMWFGVQDLSPWEGEGERLLHMQWLRQLGADMNRFNVPGRLEPREGLWSLDGWRTLLAEHRAAGIDVLFTFMELPPWLRTRSNDGRTPPNDYARFEKHAAEFGKFVLENPEIKYVQFWNEPDSGGPGAGHGFFHGSRDDYLKMFDVFSRGFRSTNSRTPLTTGGLTLKDEITGLVRGTIIDKKDNYDVVAFHAHGELDNYEKKQLQIEGWLREAGIEKRILNSETGSRSGYNPTGRHEQAITLVKKVSYAKSRPTSELYTWFTLQDYWDMDAEADDSFGLVTTDNRVKPSLVACNELIRQLANTTPDGECDDLRPGVRILRFLREDGKAVHVCWATAGEAAAQLWLKTSHGQTIRIQDLYGRSTTPTIFNDNLLFVPVGKEPLYLITSSAEKLQPATTDEIFAQVPPSLHANTSTPSTFPLIFSEPQKRAASGEIMLKTQAGEFVWRQNFVLKQAEHLKTTATISPLSVQSTGEAEARTEAQQLTLTISWTPETRQQEPRTDTRLPGATTNSIEMPILVVSAYPVPRIHQTPFDPAGARTISTQVPIRLNQASQVTDFVFDPSVPAWGGETDLSAETRIAHDGKGLFFRFDVTDDKHVQTSYPSRLDRGDSINISIAGRDGVTSFLAGLRDSGETVIWCNRSPNNKWLGHWDVPLRIGRVNPVTENGATRPGLTRYEFYIPFDRLGISYRNTSDTGTDTESGKQLLRFAFHLNEDDNIRPDRWQRRIRILRWHDGAVFEPDCQGYGILE
ncbi:MAG: hypothetical protein LBK99_04980 [Opitutaceae bacterium]|jgi:hypothetical protein|nr:hypothetical protein [Opitutaceae bacterium]